MIRDTTALATSAAAAHRPRASGASFHLFNNQQRTMRERQKSRMMNYAPPSGRSPLKSKLVDAGGRRDLRAIIPWKALLSLSHILPELSRRWHISWREYRTQLFAAACRTSDVRGTYSASYQCSRIVERPHRTRETSPSRNTSRSNRYEPQRFSFEQAQSRRWLDGT